jgi:hypothetical protein
MRKTLGIRVCRKIGGPAAAVPFVCYPNRYPGGPQGTAYPLKLLISLVTPAGFEPATLRLGI